MEIQTFIFNPFMENTYLIYDETKQAAIIDAGCLVTAEKEKLSQFIKINQLQVKYVLNTHLHLDHQFGNSFLFQTFGIKPLAHAADEYMIEHMGQQASAFGVHIEDGAQNLGGKLQDGDLLQIGNFCLEVIHTPGHSQGGVCFYNSVAKKIFTGDTLFQGSIGRTDLPGGSYEELITSIQKRLLCLPNDTIVYSGHGGTTTIGYEKDYNPYI